MKLAHKDSIMGQRKGKRKTRIRIRRPKGERNNNPTAGSSSSSAPPPPWIELPRDVTANILRRLSPVEILEKAERVCTTWRSVCGEPSFWRVIDMRYSGDLYTHDSPDTVCRRAVDRSQGELIDINIGHLGNDDLLRYISQRSSHLKILTLESCGDISPGSLTTVVKNFPHLEELHLFFTPEISYLDIETIGVSCPMLNSFTLNNRVFELPLGFVDNNLALSISKNMPNLRRLGIVGNNLGNEGLLAILDGCPNLELLDLLHCLDVDLQCDDLGRRCSEQVKKLRGPSDPTAGCEWDARVYDPDYLDGFSDGYPDDYSVGYDSCFEDDLFYNLYDDDDPADFYYF